MDRELCLCVCMCMCVCVSLSLSHSLTLFFFSVVVVSFPPLCLSCVCFSPLCGLFVCPCGPVGVSECAFHCTYGTARPLLDALHAAFPTDVFALLDYPTDIDGVPLHAFLHTLSSPSRWKSVEYLRTCLCRCSRDLQWKSDVLVELELLAETEFAQYERTQQEQSDEIDEVGRLTRAARLQRCRCWLRDV